METFDTLEEAVKRLATSENNGKEVRFQLADGHSYKATVTSCLNLDSSHSSKLGYSFTGLPERLTRMNIYLLTNVSTGSIKDAFASMVVAAADELQAIDLSLQHANAGEWASPKHIGRELIGIAREDMGQGIILTDYRPA